MNTNALVWRCCVKNASGYTRYLGGENGDRGSLLQSFYNVANVSAWATERIEALLGEAATHWHGLNEQDAADALDAASESVEALRQAGFDHLLPGLEPERMF